MMITLQQLGLDDTVIAYIQEIIANSGRSCLMITTNRDQQRRKKP